MNSDILYLHLLQELQHNPTESQEIALKKISSFLVDEKLKEAIFLLKGFAGTGKTTIISALVHFLHKTPFKVVLLAPTGRAAKVITDYSQQRAYTIHKYIYHPKTQQGSVDFRLKNNKDIDTIYIVDEASMVSNTASFEETSLLDDLVKYVYLGKRCKLILVGDTAQLPPVNTEVSPALDPNYLTLQYDRNIQTHQLTQVVRQGKKSGILHNATLIRKQLKEYFYGEFCFEIAPYRDIVHLTSGQEIQEALQDAYHFYGIEQTAFIVRSNKRATQYNKQIRKVILGQEEELSTGDLLMVVKNNYFWIDDKTQAGFIANGDTIQILEIYRYEQLYGFRFAEVKVQMTDYPNQEPFDVFLILDVIESETASLTYEQNNSLYQQIMNELSDEPSKYKKYQQIKNNPFYNALQVKYSYAMTCHKSQGGQWEVVFIEKPYLPEGITKEYLRWLYTAITRAKKRVYLLNFAQDDFKDF